jgi:putative hydrolase of HD superfamily
MNSLKVTTSANVRRYKVSSNLKKVLGFVKMTHSFRGIERDILLSKERRLENNTEHSYQLAVVSWYISEIEDFNLDIDRVIKYALIHDLVEVYAGDTPLYSSDEDFVQSKKDREKVAASRIKRRFPEFPELHKLIREYEERSNLESKFVYTVDKLLPILSIYLDKGHAWKSNNISIEMIINKNISRISLVPEIKKYFDAMVVIMREKPEYFIVK